MSSAAPWVVETTSLSKTYGHGVGAVEAVRGVDLTVRQGEVFGFLGPNGAGKSTTISMLCTLVRPTGGRALVTGLDVHTHPHEVRQRIGLVFQDPSLDERLTAFENMELHGLLYGVPRAERRRRIGELLELVSLSDRARELVQRFSGGMKRRLEIARGLLHHPTLLFLDEPTLGLDPQTRNLMWDYILKLQREQGITIFLTTHYMEEAEHCDRIAIIDQGRIIAQDTPTALKAGLGSDRVEIGTSTPEATVHHIAEQHGLTATVDGDTVWVEVPDGAAFMPRLLAHPGLNIERLAVHRPTLEDVFLSLTGTAINDDSPDAFAAIKASTRRGRGL